VPADDLGFIAHRHTGGDVRSGGMRKRHKPRKQIWRLIC
jgi:hypothetical protein